MLHYVLDFLENEGVAYRKLKKVQERVQHFREQFRYYPNKI